MTKVRMAAENLSPTSLMLVGGVSANAALRKRFQTLAHTQEIPAFLPDKEFTGDNAAMIAAAGYFRRQEASRNAWKNLTFTPRLTISA